MSSAVVQAFFCAVNVRRKEDFYGFLIKILVAVASLAKRRLSVNSPIFSL
jgi:hypothetical protein